MTRNRNEQLKELLSIAIDLKNSGELEVARFILERLAEYNPYDPSVFGLLGIIFWNLKIMDQAEHNFRKTTQLSPHSETASLGLFHSLWEQDKLDKALEEMKRFIRLKPSEEYTLTLEEIKQSMEEAEEIEEHPNG
jgi:tetratricopeptide (TPR) repeat protein